MSVDSQDTVEAYLSVCDQFKLGELPTESSNPATATLSQLCASNDTVPKALETLQNVDIEALEGIVHAVPQMEELATTIHQVLESGKKIVCEGCGATGRLSLSLEAFTQCGMVPGFENKVVGFMAGGDVAFIRSIEQFEDRVEHGQKQLHEVKFEDGDLLIAITEGGETPFVIAACEEALKVSTSTDPYFVYCNPDEVLCRVAERSKRVIENDRIKKINICVGNMAITGSTRMQATTVQLTCVGLAIQHHADPSKIGPSLQKLITAVKSIRYADLAPLTVAEAKLYRDGEYFLYECSNDMATTVMTDTTERSPTFSLPCFENFHHQEADKTSPSAQAYLYLRGTKDSAESWSALLGRAPRALEWPDTADKTGAKSIAGYDFSDEMPAKRAGRLGDNVTNHRIAIAKEANGLSFALRNTTAADAIFNATLTLDSEIMNDILLVNVVAKTLLNAHSTALMGVNQRYEGNVMTWVRPTNNKLIDRAARYVTLLLNRRGKVAEGKFPTYEAICRRIFEIREKATTAEPVVLLVVESFEKELTA